MRIKTKLLIINNIGFILATIVMIIILIVVAIQTNDWLKVIDEYCKQQTAKGKPCILT